MQTKLREKVALITGSGRHRVGNVVAEALTRQGYAIAVHYNHSATEARQTVQHLQGQGATARSFQADVSVEVEVERLVHQTVEHFGRIDVLVTAAAVWEPKPLESVTAEDLRRQFEINTLGTFLCCQKAGLVMVDQAEGGSIVTIGDWATARPYPDYAAYFASKGAIPTITRTLAVELARRNRNIRVNCILPGPVMLPSELSSGEGREAVSGTLLKRRGRPEDVARAVVFLVENDFVTGVCIPVDGGRTISPG